MPTDPRLIYLAGVLALDTRNPARDYAAACECFQRLVADHAESRLAADAAVWLGLLADVRVQAETMGRLKAANTRLQQAFEDQQARLSRMEKRLERLKAVDLTME